MKTYDLIFSFGRACACSQALRKAGLQLLSFPWDWIALDRVFGSDIRFRADKTCSGFNEWFTPEDLTEIPSEDWTPKRQFKSKSTSLAYLHDFPKDKSIESVFPDVKAKYDRRFARLVQLINNSKDVLIVCLDLPGLCAPTTIDDARYVRKRLSERFPNVRFDFTLISYERGVPVGNRRTETPDEGLLHITFDFKDYTPGKPDYAVDIDTVTAILRERFAVREYRTKDEIAAHKLKMHKAKMREAGASTPLQYRLLHIRRHLAKLALVASPRIILARLRQKRFAHIISLGSNCEVSFRFCHRWGFVDSSLFSWVFIADLEMLVRTLRNLDAFCTGELSLNPSLMWVCGNTGVRIHGRMKKFPNQPPPSDEAKAADKADLLGRVAHLKEKLRRQAADEESTLFVLRIPQNDCKDAATLASRVDAVEDALRSLGARNWKLLLLAEGRLANRIPSGENRIVRSIRAFNPTNDVTTAELGDPVGWQAVFTEFAPEKVIKSSKKFKFEK